MKHNLEAPAITPGPWHYGDLSDSVINPKGQAICELPCMNDADINAANGKAMAALPDVLEALEKALFFICDTSRPAPLKQVLNALEKAGYTL